MYLSTATLISLLTHSLLTSAHPASTSLSRRATPPERRHAAVVYLCDCEAPTTSKRYSLHAYYPDFLNRNTPIANRQQPDKWSRVTNDTYAEWAGSSIGWVNFNGDGTDRSQFTFESNIRQGTQDFTHWAGRGSSPQKGGFLCFQDDHRVLFERTGQTPDDTMQCYSKYYCQQ